MGKLPQYARRGTPMCVGQLRLCLVWCMLRTLRSYPPPQGTSFPRHPQSLSLTHALGMASYNRGLSLSEPIKAKAGTGTGLSRTSCQQESSAPMRSYVPPTPLISERGIMTRHQDPCGGAGIRSHVCARGQMGMTPL